MMMLNRVNPSGRAYKLREIFGEPDKTSVHIGNKSMVMPMSIREMDQVWYDWVNGAFIQDAFKRLNASQREFLMTGLFDDEFKAITRTFDESA